ncbi:Zn-dependent protease (includes SpoIVFB) [Sulfitobacter marinus]|uniref:Zinc metalloprotease n=1 Tax=Sulfitobacter marinus TaxID=394264 RepID=A0A1I6QSH9_9RHOB|nr:site-2 protease family protein [Sulfitobacter marinus]SFS55349.1 Zn-dependent protease (includes SpoIVFB) [Sulfitobacter marinus]
MWGNAIKIAQLRGFDIKIDASWVLIAALMVWSLSTTYFPSQLPDLGRPTILTISVISMLGLFGSLLLHELAHAVVAARFGVKVAGITLFLFGGVAELQSEPQSGNTEFWIAIAGPLASAAIALAFWFSELAASFAGLSVPVQAILSYLAVINLVLALFNLLPAFPMDGGRVLRAWLWARSGDLMASTRRAVAISSFFAYGLMALGLYAVFSGAPTSGFWPVLIGLFLLATSRATLTQLETKTALEGRSVASLMTRNPWTAEPDMSLSELVNRVFLKHSISFAPVVESGTLLGYVDTQILHKIDREHWTTTIVEDVVEPTSSENTVSFDVMAVDLIELMQKTGRRKFLVVEAHDLVGVITLANMMALLNVSRDIN